MKYRNLKMVLLWILFFASVLAVFSNKTEISIYYPSVSARYSEGELTPDIVANALETAEVSEEPIGMDITFWGQQKDAKIIYNESTATSNMIFYQGNSAQVYPSKLLAGSYPTSKDRYGCVLSGQLAFILFRNINVVGMSVLYDDNEYIIRGIFDAGEENLAMIPLDEEQVDKLKLSYTGVEFHGETNSNKEDKAKQVQNKLGLPATDQIFDGSIWIELIGALSYIPIIFCMIWMAIRIFYGDTEKIVRTDETFESEEKAKSSKGKWIAIGISGIVALFLPTLLKQIPAWIVPSQWSNFSYWDTLSDTMRKMWLIWLSAEPGYQDTVIRNLMLKQILLVVLSILGLGIVIIYDMRTKPTIVRMEK